MWLRRIGTSPTTFAALVADVCWPPNAVAFGTCSEPREPTIPTGAYAEPYQMESAQRSVSNYMDDIEDYRQCLRDKMQSANENGQQVLDQWNRAVDAYNRSN